MTASPMGGSSSGSPTAARISSMIMILVRLCLPPEAGDTGRPVRRMAGAMVSRKPMEGSKAATVARISWYDMGPDPTAAPVEGGVMGMDNVGLGSGCACLAWTPSAWMVASAALCVRPQHACTVPSASTCAGRSQPGRAQTTGGGVGVSGTERGRTHRAWPTAAAGRSSVSSSSEVVESDSSARSGMPDESE